MKRLCEKDNKQCSQRKVSVGWFTQLRRECWGATGVICWGEPVSRGNELDGESINPVKMKLRPG